MNKYLFKQFNTAVDSFDFRLRKNASQTYILEISAMAGTKPLQKSNIILNTEDLFEALNKSIRILNDDIREIAPGIKLQGDLRTKKEGITLTPSTKSSREIAPGITLQEETYDCCGECDCEDYEDEDYDFFFLDHEEDEEDDDLVDEDILTLAKALAKILNK